MTIRSRMSLIMDPIRPEQPGLFALELGKIAEFYIVYTLVLFTLYKYYQITTKLVQKVFDRKTLDEFDY